MRKPNCLFCLFLFFAVSIGSIQAQNIPIGQWRAHLGYTNGQALAQSQDKVYCGTNSGLFSIKKSTLELEAFSTVDGFSGINVIALAYNTEHGALFIGYENAYIDILQGNRILTLKELSLKDPTLRIISFYTTGDLCYINTSHGIVVYDISKQEFGDTYFYIGPDSSNRQIAINSTVIHEGFLYAASNRGVQRFLLASNELPQDYKSWKWVSSEPAEELVSFAGYVFAVFLNKELRYLDGNNWVKMNIDTTEISSLSAAYGKLLATTANKYVVVSSDLSFETQPSWPQNDGLIDQESYIFFARNTDACLRVKQGEETAYLKPSSHALTEYDRMFDHDGEIWVAPGGLNLFGAARYNNDGFAVFKEGVWTNYRRNLPDDIRDVNAFAWNLANGHAWIASLSNGLYEFDGNSAVAHYDPGIMVMDLTYDSNGILWRSNYRASLASFSELSAYANGKWYHFELTDFNPNFLIADNYNNIWITTDGGGVAVLNYGNSIDNKQDDKVVYLQKGEGFGNLPSNEVKTIVKDRDGQIWIGTTDGIAVFSEPSLVFDNKNFDAYRPWVTRGGTSGALLSGVEITDIAVDGANRKWISTRNGAWLVSPDGTEIIHNFTTENSPIISDFVKSVDVEGEHGEVFFATDKGVISYRSVATQGEEVHKGVYAFPNPVRPDYNGPIAIKGLVTDARVKITDIAGRLVYETVAEGGQAIWSGTNFSGARANSGIYMVFSTNEDGTETFITKILIIR